MKDITRENAIKYLFEQLHLDNVNGLEDVIDEFQKQMEMASKDPYADENGCLKNKLGIKNPIKLERFAKNVSNLQTKRMLTEPILPSQHKVYSVGFLKELHNTLLGEVYDWAGKYRECEIGVEYDHVAYEHWENVPSKLSDALKNIYLDYLKPEKSLSEHIMGLALVFGNVKTLQPFRDGNTRTAELFTEFVASGRGLVVDFASMNKDPERFGQAQMQARDGDYWPLVLAFSKNVYPASERPNLELPRVKYNPDGPALSSYIKKKYGPAVVFNRQTLTREMNDNLNANTNDQTKSKTETRHKTAKSKQYNSR